MLKVLFSEFTQARVNHVHREGNTAAHQLARMGIGCSQEIMWFEEPPYLLLDVLFEKGM